MIIPQEYTRDMLSIYDLCQNGLRTLGPGLRYTIWTQGCLQHCEGCATPESRPISNKKRVRVPDLAADILSRPLIEGITISGGEPFLQAAALANLLETVLKVRPELNVISFTGYYKESLMGIEAKRLLKYIDLLVDGPYVKSLNDGKGLRGSSNQHLHFLSARLLPWKEELECGKRKVEFHVGPNGVKAYGIPSRDMMI